MCVCVCVRVRMCVCVFINNLGFVCFCTFCFSQLLVVVVFVVRLANTEQLSEDIDTAYYFY